MCECCSRDGRTTMIAYTRGAIVIREKFIRPKTLGIEVQGHKHGSFYRGNPEWRQGSNVDLNCCLLTPSINLSGFPFFLNITEPNNCSRRVCSSVTFKTWVRFPSAPPRDYMISDRLSILERKPCSLRMAARDNAGKSSKKTKRHYKEHYRKDWDKDLWD